MTLLFHRKMITRGLLPLATALFLSCSCWAAQDYHVVATAQDPNDIFVSWNTVSAIGSGDSIILERQNGTNGWSWLADLSISAKSYDDMTVKGGLNYSYRISQDNWSPDAGCCRYSEGYEVTPSGAPSGLQVTGTGSTSVSLRWTDNTYIEDGFEIQRKTWGSSSWTTVAELSPNIVTYTDYTAQANKVYSYRIEAYGFDTTSPYSNEVCAKTP